MAAATATATAAITIRLSRRLPPPLAAFLQQRLALLNVDVGMVGVGEAAAAAAAAAGGATYASERLPILVVPDNDGDGKEGCVWV